MLIRIVLKHIDFKTFFLMHPFSFLGYNARISTPIRMRSHAAISVGGCIVRLLMTP